MSAHPVLLLDLDGTITDSLEGIANSLHHALEAVGATWDDTREISSIAGPPMPDTLASLGLDPATVERAMYAYRERYTSTGWLENRVYPGMRDLIGGLADDGFRIAVATSKDQRAARRILEHFDLASPFAFIGGADLGEGRSAKSEVIAHSLSALGIDPDSIRPDAVIMIGDRSHDVEGAAKHGIDTAFVRWGYGTDAEAASARWVAESSSELGDILRTL